MEVPLLSPCSCWPDISMVRCTCSGSQGSQAYVRGALTLNQSETDKSKHTNLKSVLTFSGQCCLRCVFQLLTWLILHFPLRVYGCMLWTLCYPATLVQDKAKNVEVRCSSRVMLSKKGLMHHWLCLTNDRFRIIMWYFAMDVSPTGIEYIACLD